MESLSKVEQPVKAHPAFPNRDGVLQTCCNTSAPTFQVDRSVLIRFTPKTTIGGVTEDNASTICGVSGRQPDKHGSFFFTVALLDCRRRLLIEHSDLLREAFGCDARFKSMRPSFCLITFTASGHSRLAMPIYRLSGG